MTGTRISYFLCQHVPIKFRSLFVLLWLIFKVIENDAEVIAGKIDLTVLHKCQQHQGNVFREVTIHARMGKARCARRLYPLNRLTPAPGISKTMQKMWPFIKHDSGPDCSTTVTDVLKAVLWGSWMKKLGLLVGTGPSWGNIKGAKNLNSTPGNAGHMSGIIYVVTQRVTLHQQALEWKGKHCWDRVHSGLPTWAHALLGRRCCLPLGAAFSYPGPLQQHSWAESRVV